VRQIALQVNSEGVVRRAIVRFIKLDVGNIGLLADRILRIEGREQTLTRDVVVSTVGVHPSLADVIGAQRPIRIEGILYACAGVQRVGSVMVRIDQGASAAVGCAAKASWVTGLHTIRIQLVNGLKR